MSAAVLFVAVFAFLLLQMRAGHDPVLGAAATAQPAQQRQVARWREVVPAERTGQQYRDYGGYDAVPEQVDPVPEQDSSPADSAPAPLLSRSS
jgi:hypothetical protein